MAQISKLLELSHVTKRYDTVDGTSNPAVLNDISLEVEAGESLAVVGASGSGKSTLLNIISALDRPSQGQVSLAGRDLSLLNDEELSKARNEEIGFIFQSHHLLGQCTVLENVLVPTLLNRDKKQRRQLEQRARQLLMRVGLKDRITYRPGQLSGGERQRVAVIRAIINKPKLLLADEPTGSLDARAAEQLGDLLVELNHQERMALILVTHSLKIAQKTQSILELREGKLIPLNNH